MIGKTGKGSISTTMYYLNSMWFKYGCAAELIS